MLRKKTSPFRFNTALRESSSLSDILPFRCSISGRTSLFAKISVSGGLSGKFEQLDRPSFFSEFMENTFLKDFSSFILFSMHSWLAFNGHSVTLNSDTLCLDAIHNQVSFHVVLSPMLAVFNNTLTHSPF